MYIPALAGVASIIYRRGFSSNFSKYDTCEGEQRARGDKKKAIRGDGDGTRERTSRDRDSQPVVVLANPRVVVGKPSSTFVARQRCLIRNLKRVVRICSARTYARPSVHG